MGSSGYYTKDGLEESAQRPGLLRKQVLAHRGEIEWASWESVAPPLTCYVTLNKLPNLSVPLENRDHNSSHPTRLSGGLDELTREKCLEQGLMHNSLFGVLMTFALSGLSFFAWKIEIAAMPASKGRLGQNDLTHATR